MELAALLTAISSAVGVLVGAWWTGHKHKAEIKKILAEAEGTTVDSAFDAAERVIGILRQEVEDLNKRVSSLEKQLEREKSDSVKLEIKYQQALTRIRELEAENRQLRAEIDLLRAQLTRVERAINGHGQQGES